jgi:hypothetical protein
MAKLNAIEDLQDRVKAPENLTVLRGHGRANTLQAKAIKFVMNNQAVLEEIIAKYQSATPANI